MNQITNSNQTMIRINHPKGDGTVWKIQDSAKALGAEYRNIYLPSMEPEDIIGFDGFAPKWLLNAEDNIKNGKDVVIVLDEYDRATKETQKAVDDLFNDAIFADLLINEETSNIIHITILN